MRRQILFETFGKFETGVHGYAHRAQTEIAIFLNDDELKRAVEPDTQRIGLCRNGAGVLICTRRPHFVHPPWWQDVPDQLQELVPFTSIRCNVERQSPCTDQRMEDFMRVPLAICRCLEFISGGKA